MTWILVAVTLVSLATAGVLLAYVVRLARTERDRSEARVAALSELLQAQDPSLPPLAAPATDPVEAAADFRWAAGTSAPISVRDEAGDTIDGRRASAEAAFDEAQPVWRVGLLGETGTDFPRTARPLLIPAIGALIVGLALTALYSFNRPGATATAAAAGPGSLELLSMRHERDGDTLTVSGLVRVPAGGRAMKDVTAVVITFDRQGTFLASGQSPLDFRQLAPGDESPFLVRLPGARIVGRYRVTFRNDQGVVPHVDRRDQPPAAIAQAADERPAGVPR